MNYKFKKYFLSHSFLHNELIGCIGVKKMDRIGNIKPNNHARSSSPSSSSLLWKYIWSLNCGNYGSRCAISLLPDWQKWLISLWLRRPHLSCALPNAIYDQCSIVHVPFVWFSIIVFLFCNVIFIQSAGCGTSVCTVQFDWMTFNTWNLPIICWRFTNSFFFLFNRFHSRLVQNYYVCDAFRFSVNLL